MYLRHLSLAYYRSYPRLDLMLPEGLSIFWGDNGQGKSNLLEAAYLLATSRSFRTSSERDLVSWYADTQPVFARVAGEVVRHGAVQRLEVLLAESPGAAGGVGAASAAGEGTQAGDGAAADAGPAPGRAPATSVRRRVRINNHDRPVLELLGHFNTVLFSPEDVELVAGPAEIRRRYLDITLCQIDHRYLRTLRRYLRVLTQRNALLRRAREGHVPADQFEYWDAQLTELGAELIVARLRAVAYLNRRLEEVYPQLTSDGGRLRLAYRSTVPLDPDFQVPEEIQADEVGLLHVVQLRFGEHLAAIRVRERQQGVTLAGTHRDDAVFAVDGVELRTYGSRGQQRTAALALKLAETALMQRTTGERPVLLLDDVMSELDPTRRAFLQDAVKGHEQVLITATDLSFFSPAFLERTMRYHVRSGAVHREE